MVSWPHYSSRNCHQYPMNSRLQGPQNHCGHFGEKRNILPLSESNLGLSSLQPSHYTKYSPLSPKYPSQLLTIQNNDIPYYKNFSCFSAIVYFNPLVLEWSVHSDVQKAEIEMPLWHIYMMFNISIITLHIQNFQCQRVNLEYQNLNLRAPFSSFCSPVKAV